MKTTGYILGVFMISFMYSCVNQKYIYKNNRMYEAHEQAANPEGEEPTQETKQLLVHYPHKGFKATISDKGDYITIKPEASATFKTDTLIENLEISGWRSETVGKYYFAETKLDPSGSSYRLKYFDTKPVLQALTVPLKIRPKLTNTELKDSFPSQAETGFNVGIAFGWKFTHNVYSPDKNVFGKNTNSYSFSPGIFLGTGAVDLKKSNTRNPVIVFERKAALVTTGGYLMFGFNNINFGYAFGADFATGTGSKQWLYQGKLWHGVIFAIDILK